MKLKNNSIGHKVMHYISTQGGRKTVTIETNQTVEIVDCERIINEIEIQNQWVSIVDEVNAKKIVIATEVVVPAVVIEETVAPEVEEIAAPIEEQPVDKMEEASKNVESYMSETDTKSETEESAK